MISLGPVLSTAPAVPDGSWDRVLELAWGAFVAGTTPVGAVVIDAAGRIVAEGQNRRYGAGPARSLTGGHVAHAEMIALCSLSAGRRWLDHALVTSLEPCAMCHGAALQATVGSVHYAAADPWGGTAHVDLGTPQARRRGLTVRGPLADDRGVFAALLHVVWLAERPSAAHIVDQMRADLPEVTVFAERGDVRRRLAEAARDGATADEVRGSLLNAPD